MIDDVDTIALTTTTDGATIHYTTNGNDPTDASPIYSSPFSLSADATVKAFAVKTGLNDSAIAQASFTIIQTVATPTISPAGGTYNDSVEVSLETIDAGRHDLLYHQRHDAEHRFDGIHGIVHPDRGCDGQCLCRGRGLR